MKLLDWAKTAFYISLTVFIGFGSYFAWTATQTVKQLGKQAGSVLAQASVSLDKTDKAVSLTSQSLSNAALQLSGVSIGINTALSSINRTCLPGPCGTLSDINKTLGTFRLTAGQIEVAANHEDKNLSTLDSQELSLFDHTNLAISGLTGIESNLNKTTTDFDVLVSSPDLSKTLGNFQTLTYNLGQTSGDLQTKLHPMLFPAPCISKFCFFKKSIPYIKGALDLSEPSYYFWQILRNIPEGK